MSIFKRISKDTGIPVSEIKEANMDQNSDDVNSINLEISNLEEAKENFVFLTKLLQKSLEDWNKLALVEAEKAYTPDQVMYVFENAPPETESYIEAFNKLLLMHNSVSELADFYYYFDIGSPEGKVILKKIINLYKQEDNS